MGGRKQGHLNVSMRTWRRQYNADGPAHIIIWYEAGAKDWLEAVVGEDESSAKG